MTSKTTPSTATPSTGPTAGTHAHNGTTYIFDEGLGYSSTSVRTGIVEVPKRELIGPAEGDTEIFITPPDGRYLLGHIASIRLSGAVGDLETVASTGVPVTGAEEEMTNTTVEEDPGEDTDDESVRHGLTIPVSTGLCFQVPADPAKLESIVIHVNWGTHESTGRDDAEALVSSSDPTSSRGSHITRYRRIPYYRSFSLRLADLTPGRTLDRKLENDVFLHVDLYRDISPAGGSGGRYLIELVLCNDQGMSCRIFVHVWMFQTQTHVDANNRDVFLPVRDLLLPPTPGVQPASDPEEAYLELQYRDRLEFAVGRTCSADRGLHKPPSGENAPRRAFQVCTTWTPVVEMSRTTVTLVQGAELNMRTLVAAAESPDVAPTRDALKPIVEAYTAWLGEQEAAIAALPKHLRDTGAEALAEALQARGQLMEGIDHLLSDPEARHCFAFTNRAMAGQRVRFQIATARTADSSLSVEEAEARVLADGYPHHWHVFRPAFILMQLPALTDLALPRRSGDLVAARPLSFPTGGGKTGAYLGLVAYAFAICHRQGFLGTPDGPIDRRSGVTVLMRYILRLPTSQQFQRVITLVHAAELARHEDPATWGEEPFRIGLWVGIAVSPKRVSEAEKEFERLNDRGGSGAGYHFSALQLGHCPWCGCPLTPGDVKIGPVAGSADRVILCCSDELGQCPFSEGDGNVPDGLPILTTSEETYWFAPAFVIVTVDKLTRLAREEYAATLFGHATRRCERHDYVPYSGHDSTHDLTGCTLGENGRHQPKGELPATATRPATWLRPPDLIIQDELHLTTGALGTTVGLFEAVVETTRARRAPDGRPARPLPVASSAAVRNVADQVRSLYGRDVAIFPPQVLDASDTFFSRMVPVDAARPGRLYVGLSTTGVRLIAAEIQTTQTIMADAQLLFDQLGTAADPYMALAGYFSVTRELAGMARYVQDDIQAGLAKPGRDSRLSRRRGIAFGALNLGEFTSRVASTDITVTLDRMVPTFDPSVDSTTAKVAAAAAA